MKAVQSYSILKRFTKASPKDQKLILKLFGDELMDALAECALNISKNKVKMTANRKKNLLRFQDEIITLANKKVSRKHKKKIISQKGGAILPFLIPPALHLLTELLSNQIKAFKSS